MVFCWITSVEANREAIHYEVLGKRPLTLPYIKIIDHLDAQSNIMIASGLLGQANPL